MIDRLRARNEWIFFSVLPDADRLLAVGWWTTLVLRGLLPAFFAIAMGVLIAAVEGGRYRTMFELQASRFVEQEEREELVALD